uniref:carboxylesterase n=1 Tax=Haematobia irritans TaxID=7368 RepID=A0A1L8EGG4_HAEIR
MDVSLGFQTKLVLGSRFISHKIHQLLEKTTETDVITLSQGQLKGLKRSNVYEEFGSYYSFEGIPYAKPPLGELRFRAPQPADPWQGILKCFQCKSKPVQYNLITKWVEGSEDCLYVNVYAKKLQSPKPLPVMVWIYGGGYQVGESSRDMYSPDYFLQRDVVFVTFNYRLGILGFLCFDDPDLNIPGNAGLKDQVLALKWVKQNIHKFNGDPNNITVFGESAGGASTQFMTMTPQTKGLFHKAIIQSGSFLCPWSFTDSHDWGYKFACHVGYKGENEDKSVYQYLSQKSAKSMFFNDLSLMSKNDLMNNLIVLMRPVIEPYSTPDCVMDKPLIQFLKEGWGNEIPLMIGGNSFEGLLHYATATRNPFIIDDLSDFVNLLPDDVQRKRPSEELKTLGLRLKEVYFAGKQPNVTENLFQFLNLMSYRSFWHSIHRSICARGEYAKGVPTYCYYFDFDSEFFNLFRTVVCGPSIRGTAHADDLSYLFHGAVSGKVAADTKEFLCIQRMIGMWYNFALSSNPNCEEIQPANWKPIEDFSTAFKCLCINDDLEFKELPIYDKLKIWDEFYRKDELC